MKNQFSVFFIILAVFTGVHHAAAQNTVFTYQGRVTDGGTNFNGVGHFEFALVTSTNANSPAMATASLSGTPPNEFVTSYTVVTGGGGYLTAPAVTIAGGGGSGATATAHLTGGVVTSITPGSAGLGYSSLPTVTLAPPPANISYTTYWSNDGTSVAGSEPSAAVSVTVSNGLFTVVLGDAAVPNMAGISSALFSQPNLQLRIWFNDGVSGFAALAPVQNLTPTPYAVFANMANTASNLVSSAQFNVNGLSIQTNTNGAPNLVGGASVNYVSNSVIGATIAGGGATFYTIFNSHEQLEVISVSNAVTANFGTVSGGENNKVYGLAATVAGGANNISSNYSASVGGGDANTANGNGATVCGGEGNTASGQFSVVCGGNENLALGDYSFAAGGRALAMHPGAFVWADSQIETAYSSDRANQFKVRAGGGVQFDISGSSGLNPAAITINSSSGNGIGLVVNQSSSDTSALFANGGTGDIIKGFSGNGNTVFEVQNDGTVYSKGAVVTSDRNAKQNFTALDSKDVLARVISLPVTEWNYKDDPADKKHVGPMAQDFQAAFGLNGADDKHISIVDEGGVALAAIQGLNLKLNEKDAEIQSLKKENDTLAARLEELASEVKSLAEKK